MQPVRIKDRFIGPAHPVFVIAEAGVNHDGDIEKALDLANAAKDAGADCVKFQTFRAERVARRDARKAAYQKALTDPGESQTDMLRRLELADDDLARLIEHCATRDILFLSTPYNRPDVDRLTELGAEAFKLASIHIAEPEFLRYAAAKGKPVIVSTGMADMSEISTGLDAVRATGNGDIVLLQCTTNYPSRPDEANLRTIPVMRDAFGVQTGYSDHTQSPTCCIAAVALGAVAIERHLTLDRAAQGPDHAASSGPRQFSDLVAAIRETEQALGDGVKRPTPSEVENIPEMRRSIVVARDLEAGETLSLEDLDFRRPADGLPPRLASLLVGARLLKTVAEGDRLDLSMIEFR